MFTSRAEYRLHLREDNADLRLTTTGRALGLVDDARFAAFEARRAAIEAETARLRGLWAAPNNALGAQVRETLEVELSRETCALDLLRRPQLDYAALARVPGIGPGVDDPGVALQVEVEAKYAGYLQRQRDEIERNRGMASQGIPADFDFAGIRGLSAEVAQKLARVRPATVGQAARISGVTPAAISLLLVHLKRAGRAA
jgi:tRNA uridine 5-carboxymethylaminomethyl modification enzyme